MRGGDTNGRTAPANLAQVPANSLDQSNATAFQGLILRNVATDDIILSGNSATQNGNINTGTVPAAVLAGIEANDPGAVYVVEFLDFFHGSWGWVNVDFVDIPGDELKTFTANNNIIKQGDGILTLTGSNAHNGATRVEGGKIVVANDNALGDVAGGTWVEEGATLALNNTLLPGTDASGNIEIPAGESISVDGNGITGELPDYDFNNNPNDLDGWTVSSGTAGNEGGGNSGQLTAGHTGNFGSRAHDAAHETYRVTSPAFTLNGSGDLTFDMRGGDTNGRSAPANLSQVPANSLDQGAATAFQGMILRNIATDDILLSGNSATQSGTINTGRFTAAQLAGLDQNATYVAEFLDFFHGGWGWVNVDAVSIPGNDVSANSTEGGLENEAGDNQILGDVTTAQVQQDGHFQVAVTGGSLVIDGNVDLEFSQMTTAGDGDLTINGDITGQGVQVDLPVVLPATFGFDNNPNDLDGWTVSSGTAGNEGGGNSGQLTAGHTGNFGSRAHDAAHETYRVTSPQFTLNGSGDLTFGMRGGDTNGRSAPANLALVPANSIDQGTAPAFQGMILRNVATDDIPLSGNSATQNGNVNTGSFTAAQLATLETNDPGAIYVAEFLDFFHGGWGWVNVDFVSIPGDGLQRFTPNNNLVKTGDGTLTLAGNSSYNGETTVESGILLATNDNALGDVAGATTVADGASLSLDGGLTVGENLNLAGNGAAGTLGSLQSVSGDNTLSGNITAAAVAAGGEFTIGAQADSLTISGDVDMQFSKLNIDGDGNITVSGAISGVGADEDRFTAPLPDFTFDNNPNDLDGWVVSSGTAGNEGGGNSGQLTAGHTGNFGSRAHDAAHETYRVTSPEFQLSGSGGDLTFGMRGGDTNGRSAPANLAAVPGNSLADGDATAFQGIILRDVATDDILLSGNSATQSGNINTGSFSAGQLAGLDQNATYVAEFLDFFHGGWGWVNLDAVSIPGNGGETFVNNNSVMKMGNGTLTVSGANTYTGGTTVMGGTLVADTAGPDSATGVDAVDMQTGTTLAGSGNIAGDVSVATGATVTPGWPAGTAANLGVGNTTIAGGATVVIDIGSTGHDSATVTGTVDITGSTLTTSIETAFRPTHMQEFVIVDNDGADPVGGTFTGLAEGATFELDNGTTMRQFQISYVAGDGNDVVLTHINRAPVVADGGAYAINEGDPLALNGSATDPDGDPITFSWDVNGTTVAGDTPSFTWAELIAAGIDDGAPVTNYGATLSANDGELTTDSVTSIDLTNTAPTAGVSNPATWVPSLDVPFDLTASAEPSPVDEAAGFTYVVTWGDGSSDTYGPGATSAESVVHQYGQLGSYSITITASDKDGGSTVATSTIDIVPVAVIDGVLRIGGLNDRNDRIIVSQGGGNSFLVRWNNIPFGPFDTADFSEIQTRGGAGADRISYSNICYAAETHGQDGNDNIAGNRCDDVIFGGAGRDTILTGSGNNWADGGDGNDLIVSREGDDILFGGAGNDDLNAGTGDDILSGGIGNDRMTGGGGADLLIGGLGNDIIRGESGQDVLIGNGGSDTLRGGDGDDLLVGGTGTDHLHGDRGIDFLTGGEGANEGDQALLELLLTDWSVSRVTTELGTISDDPGDKDGLNGGGGADSIYVSADDDTSLLRSNDNILSF
jgi:autotransporter-associated beta strand protein